MKRILVSILACALLLAMLPAAMAAGWSGHWAAEYMQAALDYGWIDENADANKDITRAEYAVILWRALGSPDPTSAACPFTDVTDELVQTAATALFDLKVTTGTGSGGDKFSPDSSLTRQEAMTLMARAFGLAAEDPSAAAAFDDWADVDSWAQGAMAAMVELGYVNGVGGNNLAPGKSITLGEMCKTTVVLYNDRTEGAARISADDAIDSVFVLGFVDMDGSKAKAIAVKYNVDLTGAELGVGAYDIEDYGLTQSEKDLDSGSDPGKPLKAYVNNEAAVSATGGSGTGNYVIIELNTNYLVSRFPRSWKVTMFAGVGQAVAIQTKDYVITPSTEKKINYEEFEYIGIDPMSGGFRDPEYYNYALDDTYFIEGIEKYERHVIGGGTGYEAFHATNCFEEADGKRYDFDLPYALFVPEDYDPSLKYALVLHIHDAGSMDSDPMLTLTEAQGANNYASDKFQQLAKDQGLGGAIIVCPAIAEMFDMDGDGEAEFELRVARDNWTLTCAAQAIWQLMDSLVDEYNIDTNRIYGSGQSMGGMTVMEMAVQRDNYFAAIMPMSCHWGTNFNKDYEFAGDVYYNAPAGEGEVIWAEDSDGNPVNYNNWFYLASDDNILYMNTAIPEFMVLYQDLLGVSVETAEMELTESINTTNAERSAIVEELVSRDSDLGIYVVTLSGNVGHMSAWFYGHGTDACYEWLISQTRETEMARPKLDLDKPFEWADEQIHDDMHIYSTSWDGSSVVYYPTGKFGAGTDGYNSGLSKLGSNETLDPGWTPND